MDFPYGETVTLQTAGTTTDPYTGDPVSAWELSDGQMWTTAPASVDVPGVAVADGGSIEPLEDARNSVESDFDLMFPADAEVTAQNRIVVRGLTCEVSGRPFLWRNPFTGWTPGLVVKVKIKEG